MKRSNQFLYSGQYVNYGYDQTSTCLLNYLVILHLQQSIICNWHSIINGYYYASWTGSMLNVMYITTFRFMEGHVHILSQEKSPIWFVIVGHLKKWYYKYYSVSSLVDPHDISMPFSYKLVQTIVTANFTKCPDSHTILKS